MANKRIYAPNHTQSPNVLFDFWMEKLTPAEFKVIMCITRKTFGWGKLADNISLSQIVKMTGLTDRGVEKCLKSLIKHGLIIKTQNHTKKGNFVANRFEIRVLDDPEGVTNSVREGTEHSSGGGSEHSSDTKERLTKETKTKDISSADASDVNNFLFKNLKKKNPKFKIKSKKAWERNATKLLKQYSKEEVLKVIDWVYTSDHKKAEFWRDVVQSPESLYKNIDQIIIQMSSKTKAEVKKEEAQERLKLIEDNRDWALATIPRIKFDSNRYMSCKENCVEIKNGGEFIPIGYGEKKLKQIVEHKLRSWGLL